MKTVQVTGGEVTLRERQDLSVRQRQELQEQIAELLPRVQPLMPFLNQAGELDEQKALEAGVLNREALHAFLETAKVLMVTALASWTLTGSAGEPLAIPTTVDEVGDLNAGLYDELSNEVGMLDLIGEVNFEPSDPTKAGFEQTPTQPSAV